MHATLQYYFKCFETHSENFCSPLYCYKTLLHSSSIIHVNEKKTHTSCRLSWVILAFEGQIHEEIDSTYKLIEYEGSESPECNVDIDIDRVTTSHSIDDILDPDYDLSYQKVRCDDSR